MQQDVRNCREDVCVGEWWAASLFFVQVLDGDFFFFVRGRSVVRARINEELYFFLDRPFLFVQCHFDLIGRQVNKYQADSFRGYSKTPNSTRSLLGLIRLNFVVPNGSVSTWTCHVPRNQSGPRKFAVSSSASKARSHHCER